MKDILASLVVVLPILAYAAVMSVEVLDRVIGEIIKITTPLTCSGGRFPASITRKWLVEIGR